MSKIEELLSLLSSFVYNVISEDVGMKHIDILQELNLFITDMNIKKFFPDAIFCRTISSGSRSECYHREIGKESDVDLMRFPTHILVEPSHSLSNSDVLKLPKQNIFEIFSDYENSFTLTAINSDHPGYIRILGQNNKTLLSHKDLPGKSSPQMMKESLKKVEQHGPAFTITVKISPNLTPYDLEIDFVPCLKLKNWPEIAQSWIDRSTVSGFPSKEDKQAIINNCKTSANDFGCAHVVPVSHTHSQDTDTEWRLSFSVIEKMLTQSYWNTNQSVVYSLVRLYIRMMKANYPIVKSYYAKMVMFWLCEEKPKDWWSKERTIECFYEVLVKLTQGLKQNMIRHYFIPENNIIDGVDLKGINFDNLLPWKTNDLEENIKNGILNMIKCSKEIIKLTDSNLINTMLQSPIHEAILKFQIFLNENKVQTYAAKKEEAVDNELASYLLNWVPFHQSETNVIQIIPNEVKIYHAILCDALEKLNLNLKPLVEIGLAKAKIVFDVLELETGLTVSDVFHSYIKHENKAVSICSISLLMLTKYNVDKKPKEVLQLFKEIKEFLLMETFHYQRGPAQQLQLQISGYEEKVFDDALWMIFSNDQQAVLFLKPMLLIYYVLTRCFLLENEIEKAKSAFYFFKALVKSTNNVGTKALFGRIENYLMNELHFLSPTAIDDENSNQHLVQLFDESAMLECVSRLGTDETFINQFIALEEKM